MRPASTLGRLARRAALAAGVVAAMVTASFAVPAAAATAPGFRVTLFGGCVAVSGSPTALVKVQQRTPTGSILQTADVGLDGDGKGWACFADPFFSGMKITGTSGGASSSFTVPRLSVSTDRTTDVISGRSPAGKQVSVDVFHVPAFFSNQQKTYTRTASSTGTWKIDTTSAFNLIGGDAITVRYTSGPHEAVFADQVPRLIARIGSATVRAVLPVGVAGLATLKTSAGTTRGTAALAGTVATVEGFAKSSFRTSSGAPVAARVGDRVSAPFQPSMVVRIPNLTVTLDTTSDTVSGTCPANSALLVQVGGGLSSDTCTAAGTYNKTTVGDLTTGSRVTVTARLAAGDLVERTRAAQ